MRDDMTEAQNTKRPGALIAMSGGVDSSVAAWLMQQAGYDCTGITMRLTRNCLLYTSFFCRHLLPDFFAICFQS